VALKSDISAREIAAMLDAQAERFARELLPGGRKEGNLFCAGSVGGESGQSLKVNLSGAMIGKWTDFSAAKGTDDYSGDILKLIAVVKFGGWGTNEQRSKAIAWAKSALGLDDLDPSRLATVQREARERSERSAEEEAREKAAKRRRAAALWAGAQPIAGTPALSYLQGRGIDFAQLGRVPGSLRYRPDVWCRERRGKFPAMIACIMGIDGALLGVHRTYLQINRVGPVTKAKVENPKLSLGYYTGGCIPLWKGASDKTLREIPAGTPVYASEGIEDGLTIALAQPDKRIVAGVALANLGALELPPQAGPLVFIAQNDPVGSKAVDAFERAIARQQDAGRKAQLIFPAPEFKDFNDQLQGKRMGR
jgi:hypothetical protein